MQEQSHRRSTAARPAPTLVAWLTMLMVIAIVAIGGCAQAEKTRYVRHLTTVIDPSAGVPEEAILTFDIDRKKVQGAMAARVEN